MTRAGWSSFCSQNRKYRFPNLRTRSSNAVLGLQLWCCCERKTSFGSLGIPVAYKNSSPYERDQNRLFNAFVLSGNVRPARTLEHFIHRSRETLRVTQLMGKEMRRLIAGFRPLIVLAAALKSKAEAAFYAPGRSSMCTQQNGCAAQRCSLSSTQ